jgi:predicted acyltransferase
MVGIGVLLVALAWTWNMVFPINKKIWTSSFVLNTVGLDLILLGLLVYVIDFVKVKGWTGFFVTVGKNPLAIYLLSELLGQILDMIPVGSGESLNGWIITHIYQNIPPPKFGSLCYAVSYMLVCWLVGKFLEVRKIYIRV